MSIITRDSLQPPTLSRITRASSCGLSRTEVSFLSKVISWSGLDRGSLNHVLFSALRWYALIELTELQNLEPPYIKSIHFLPLSYAKKFHFLVGAGR